jgi:hypothetical protein
LIGRGGANVVSVDAPLTLAPGLRHSSACRGPGAQCERDEAHAMWLGAHELDAMVAAYSG